MGPGVALIFMFSLFPFNNIQNFWPLLCSGKDCPGFLEGKEVGNSKREKDFSLAPSGRVPSTVEALANLTGSRRLGGKTEQQNSGT